MNISLKNIYRVEEHARHLHYQWADKDSEAEALKAARARYREHMKEHGYDLPEKDENGFVDFARGSWRRFKTLFMGVGSEGAQA